MGMFVCFKCMVAWVFFGRGYGYRVLRGFMRGVVFIV